MKSIGSDRCSNSVFALIITWFGQRLILLSAGGSSVRLFPLIRLLLIVCYGLTMIGGTEVWSQTVSRPESLLKLADDCRKSLYRSPKNMAYRDNWLKCTRRYEDVFTRYPESDQAAWAIYRSARMLRKLYRYSGRPQDLDEALERLRRLVQRYPKHRLADDAQYQIGEILYQDKQDLTQAYVEFLKVDIKFPSGDMRPKARKRLDQIATMLAEREGQGDDGKPSKPSQKLTPVADIRHWSTPSYTRVVIDLERPVKYVSHLLRAEPSKKKPRRLYVDLQQAHVGADIESSIPIRDGLLQRARAAQYTKDTVRVVLDINSIGGYKIFHLHDPFRIVVDVRGREKQVVKSKRKKAEPDQRPVRKGIRKVKKPAKDLSLARQLGLSVRRIVIDPGHGGKDPGCFFKGGAKEKNIVLNLAKILAEKLEQQLGLEAVLTRNRDIFLSLEKRTAFANVKKADLFVSLHINAHKLRNVHGLETYFLNMATDERAVMVAARENATSEKHISDLQNILNDLMLNTKINESSRLAHEVQKGMVSGIKKGYKKVKSLGVKQAPFYVLIGAEMPAILVETGCITNPTERKRLQSKKYLEKLSDGIVVGIGAYIESIDEVYKGG
jgi:N-acetylmuramoyl-L-alanine amidase